MSQFRKGQSGNPAGRPRGSRNKASLVKAQLMLDDGAVNASRLLNAILTGDAKTLDEFGIKDASSVTIKAKLEAIKLIITQTSGEMKALAQEAKKDAAAPVPAADAKKPTFTNVAKISSK
ncbi:hypothetical protein [Yersinia phage vB_YenM_P778]